MGHDALEKSFEIGSGFLKSDRKKLQLKWRRKGNSSQYEKAGTAQETGVAPPHFPGRASVPPVADQVGILVAHVG